MKDGTLEKSLDVITDRNGARISLMGGFKLRARYKLARSLRLGPVDFVHADGVVETFGCYFT
jgi:hypothetical protein